MIYINKKNSKLKNKCIKILNAYFKIKSFESKQLYESFGILYFKRFLIWLPKLISKKKNVIPKGGYFLYEYSYKGLKKYIYMTYSFESWHLFGLILTLSSEHISVRIICIIINLYCIMLQRYNRLRILQIFNKYNK